MEHLIVRYQDQLKAHPAVTQVLTVASLLLTGDVISQAFFQKQKASFDVRQAIHFFVVGLVYTGPCAVTWYGVLEWLVVMDGLTAAVIKVILGQVLYTPVFTLGLLVIYGLLRGDSWLEIVQSVRAKYFALLRSRFFVYPPAQLINFEFVPVVYRPMYGSVVSLLWNMYLSWKANQVEPRTDPVEKDVGDEV
ncbi:unnamed protein product [Ixodes hexagonus]